MRLQNRTFELYVMQGRKFGLSFGRRRERQKPTEIQYEYYGNSLLI